MKSLLFALLFMVSGSVFAARSGDVVAEIDGVSTCVIDDADGATAELCFSGKGLVFGVQASSITANGNYLVLRDTDTANTSSSSFTYTSRAFDNCTASAGVVCNGSFTRPIFVINGLSANQTIDANDGSAWVIYYRKL